MMLLLYGNKLSYFLSICWALLFNAFKNSLYVFNIGNTYTINTFFVLNFRGLIIHR